MDNSLFSGADDKDSRRCEMNDSSLTEENEKDSGECVKDDSSLSRADDEDIGKCKKDDFSLSEENEKDSGECEKASSLSRADEEKASNLLNQIEDNSLDFKIARQFLKHLENNYKIYKFEFMELYQKDDEYLLIPDKSLHPTKIFIELLNYLALNDKPNSLNDMKKLSDFYEKQIARINKRTQGLKVHTLFIQPYFEFLEELLRLYAKQKNKKKIVQTFKKCLEVNSQHHVENLISVTAGKVRPYLYDELRYVYEIGFDVFGDHARLMDSFITAILYASDDEPCLVIGETGTGKEAIARMIHEFSDRNNNNFWAVNCGGFTETLFDSELSGQIKGAGTGVTTRLGAFLTACGRKQNKNGYYISKNKQICCRIGNNNNVDEPSFEQLKSIGGTLFLDEVNSIPIGLQSKLLRIIQEKEVRVVGEDRNRKFNIKIVCSSNADLDKELDENKFRRDLYQRISYGIIKLPSLREIKTSIPGITRFIIKKITARNNYNKDIDVSKEVLAMFKKYDWPGNIRELETVLHRALKRMIFDGVSGMTMRYVDVLKTPKKPDKEIDLDKFFEGLTHPQLVKKYIKWVLKKEKGNLVKAAKRAGFNNTKPMYTRMDKYNIQRTQV
ncbi:sigma 54-interacting transcriptional regulator [Thermodesulfobacteriota bacterium]